MSIPDDVSLRQVDVTNLYRRAEVEKRLARGIMDGRDEVELSDLLGLPRRDVKCIVTKLAQRVQTEGADIARVHAIKQTGALQALYLEAQEQWGKTFDPRYAEVMRGVLSDIRKIWGVEAPQRIALGVGVIDTGILGGVLDGLSDEQLDLLERTFEGSVIGGCPEGEGVPALAGLREVGGSVPLGGGEDH